MQASFIDNIITSQCIAIFKGNISHVVSYLMALCYVLLISIHVHEKSFANHSNLLFDYSLTDTILFILGLSQFKKRLIDVPK